VGLGLEQLVRRVPHVDDAVPYLHASDVFVNVSVRENLSLALLEAMAAGRAIVAVADGGTPEAIEDGVSGLLIERADAALLADALERLVGDAALRARLGDGARARYEADFTSAGWTRALEDRLTLLARDGYATELAAVARQPR
jgi:glycosyltransferase involved in cell wall biosynthesis